MNAMKHIKKQHPVDISSAKVNSANFKDHTDVIFQDLHILKFSEIKNMRSDVPCF